MNLSSDVSDAAAKIDNPHWLKLLARVGFGAKGVVYLILGVLAIQGTAGGGPDRALSEIGQQPFGRVMLSLVALGLLAYGLWRVLQSTLDPEDEGREAKAIGKRIGWCCSGLAYFALAFTAARIVLGGGGGGSGGGGGAQSGTQTLLSLPFGQWLVGIVGVGILLAAVHQSRQAITGGFREEFALGRMSAAEDTWATHAGRAGHAARAVLYAIIALFLLQAAWTASADEVGGLGEALDTLQQQPYGPWLLAAAGIGLVCYGLYCFVMARYRKAVML